MNKQNPTPTQPEKIKVLVNLGVTDVNKADEVWQSLELESRSDYIRRLIRADHRRYIRRQQAQATPTR